MQNGKPFVLLNFYGAGFKVRWSLINGNGGTHYDLSKFRQPSYIIYRLFASIYIFKYVLEAVEHFFTGFKGFI